MAAKKIDLKRVILTTDDNNILTIKGFEDEEIPFENLTDEVKEMINLNHPLNVKISKARKKGDGSGSGRPKAIKYVCPECGKKLSSKEEDLQVLCKNCNVLYQPE